MAAFDFPDTTGRPTDGSYTYTSPTGILYTWDGRTWTALSFSGGRADPVHHDSPTPPDPTAFELLAGDQWYNTSDGRLYTYTENSNGDLVWIDASPDSQTTPYWERDDATNTLSPATAGDDVDLGTGDLTATNIQTTSLNSGPLAGFRNQIINGSLDVNQRGMTSSNVTSTGNEYIIDRWATKSGRTFKLVNTPTGVPVARAIEWTGGCTLRQGIELMPNVGGNYQGNAFQVGTTWTFSFYSNVSGITDFNLTAAFFNSVLSGGSATDSQTVTCTEIETTANYSRYAATITVGAAPASTNKSYRWTIERSSGTFITTGFQLEPGPVATPFEPRPIGTEMALCQRYYQFIKYYFLPGPANSAIEFEQPIWTPMRAAATVSFTAASGTNHSLTARINNSSVTLSAAGTTDSSRKLRFTDVSIDAEL